MNQKPWQTWWRGTWLVSRREIRDQIHDWRIVAPLIGLALFLPLLMNFTAQQVVHFVQKYGANIVAERLFPFLMMVVGFFPSSISLVVALEGFAGERERRTIEPLLAAPLTDAQLYVGKLLAVLFLPLSVSYFAVGVYVLGMHLKMGWWPSSTLLFMVLLLTTVQAVMMVCAAVVISTQATSVRAASLLASLIIIPVALLLQWESMMMFWQHYTVLWATAAAVLVVAIFVSRIGLAHFNREDLLGREVDFLNIRWIGRTFWEAFRGEATSLKIWYAQIGHDLKTLRVPLIMAVGLIIAAAALGVWIAGQMPTDGLQRPDNLQEALQLAQTSGGLPIALGNWHGALSLWWHNIRALLLAAAAGALTFGVLGVLVPLLPYAIIGGGLAAMARVGWFSPWKGFATMILPHGIVEIPAMVIFIAATLQLGASLASPAPGETLGTFWLRAWARWMRIFVGIVIPMMTVAAILETWLTPWVVSHWLF